MPLGMVNFSFDLLAPWRRRAEACDIRSASAAAKKQDNNETVPGVRSEEEREHEQALFWGLFPVL
ncbi:hypothetical protein QN219_28490 [Sinorhizobium sp. 7-81]|uniref:hypothetical protein n=1 Tax=Sinorhizobium sp. 8-89 TaxID=3049089 RepID=UPI0024C31242|nr:hypothetical protein [Sinorhizobium sp. 8-89]MDK1493929.1 hypothetical protein [Sinorhizobium sp. 8-89]